MQSRPWIAPEPPGAEGGSLKRRTPGVSDFLRAVIDEIGSGHTIVTADFDGAGRDEIVTGDRGDTRRLYLYAAVDADGAAWSRHVLDEDMSPSGCAVAGLNGDARIDLVCIGGRTANLEWYENVSP